MLALLIARQNRVALVISIQALFHTMSQHTIMVGCQQRIPTTAPDHLEYLPIGAPESPLQLLNNLAVAPHRPVETLQIAVHHEHQVIQTLARGDINRAQHLGFIGLTVTDKAPDT